MEPRSASLVTGELPPPIDIPSKIVCVGLNYRGHISETGAETPQEPVLFLKDPYTIVGPGAELHIPRGSTKTDYEVELGVVIGDTAHYLPDAGAAADCIAGYVLSLDVSEREYQLERGGQWDKGKSCPTFNPLGPVLLPASALPPDPTFALELRVNGEVRQKALTTDMVFGVGHLVWYISQFMVLRPGDLINTGTPAGVALGNEAVPYLRSGDVIEVDGGPLGQFTTPVTEAP